MMTNPTFTNPAWEAAKFRLLIVRLSPFGDVERSTPHLFLAGAARAALPGAYIDLAFFPAFHEREAAGRAQLPWLAGTQSQQPPQAFDAIFISNSFVLELLNLAPALANAGAPLTAGARGKEWPPVILGGSNASACHSVLLEDGDALVDGIFFGEGEDAVEKILTVLQQERHLPKKARLQRAAAAVKGLWIPGATGPVEPAIASPIPRPTPILDGPEAGTLRLEINRGCASFCSFCFEGHDRRPYRETPLREIVRQAQELKAVQGAQTVEIAGMNINTHTHLFALLGDLSRIFDRVSFKSQRVDGLLHTPALLEAEIAAGKTSFTLGIEGVSRRLRSRLQKDIPEGDIAALLARLMRERIREIKLFYLITGWEEEADIAEFRRFTMEVRALKERHNPALRLIASFGYLVRMPFTPLRHDRLRLEAAELRPITGPLKSACDWNHIEFRLAATWEEYCVTQTLALAGPWGGRALLHLAGENRIYDGRLAPGTWESLRSWLEANGFWNEEFFGNKLKKHIFAFPFLTHRTTPAFLWKRWRQSQDGVDGGTCLGGTGKSACLACGACPDAAAKSGILEHRVHPPADHNLVRDLARTTRAKQELGPVFIQVRLAPVFQGATPEWAGAMVFRTLLAALPGQTKNLLSVSEALFTREPWKLPRLPFFGESIFALKAWDAASLLEALGSMPPLPGGDIACLAVLENFTSQHFLEAFLSAQLRAGDGDPLRNLEAFLKAAGAAYQLERNGARMALRLADKWRKKKFIMEAAREQTRDGWSLRLRIGPRFDAAGFTAAFPEARTEISGLVVTTPRS